MDANIAPKITFLNWLSGQQNQTGDKEIIAEFAKAVHKTIVLMSFTFNTQVTCTKMWQMMGELRNNPNLQMIFLASYILYMAETNETDADAEFVIDEITAIMESMMQMRSSRE